MVVYEPNPLRREGDSVSHVANKAAVLIHTCRIDRARRQDQQYEHGLHNLPPHALDFAFSFGGCPLLLRPAT